MYHLRVELIIFLSIAAFVATAPVDDSRSATILRYENDNIGIDGYKFDFQTSDGTSRQENGQLQNIGTDQEAIVVRGSYSYLGPDGIQYTVTYIADANGFRAEGAHLPKSQTPGQTTRTSALDQEIPQDIPPGALLSLIGG